MKKAILASAICSSLFMLSACDNSASNSTSNTTATGSKEKASVQADTSSTATSEHQTVAPTSGISLDNMDKSIRAQDDFYSYVNGGWIKRSEIPADKTKIGSFYDLREKADEDVKQIIEDLANQANLTKGSDEQKVADLFRSFMDLGTLNELGTDPIRGELAKIGAISNKDQLAHYFGESQGTGIESPLAMWVGIDAKDSTRYVSHIWQNGLGLPDRDYYFNEQERFVKLRKEYVAHITKMFELAGLEQGEQAASMLMALETKLATHHLTRVQTRDSEKRYNKFVVGDLTQLAADFNWQEYLKGQGIQAEKDIIINQPDFVKGFGKIFSQTSLDDWKTYLTWQVVNGYAAFLSQDLDDQNFDFYSRKLNGREKQRARWKRGVAVVNSNLGEVIGKVYVGRHFTPEAKSRMSALVENLRTAYGDSIDSLEWMSNNTKVAARKKLAAFTPKIGYPDKWEDYSEMTINDADLIGNINRARQVEHQKQISRLGQPIRKWEWGMTPQTVNAYYSSTRNEIVFPAAILQPPFFNMAADDAVNYGGIGAVIGHEMGHGFDDQGSRYDGDGNLNNWWTEQDLAEFTKRGKLLVEQYSGYQVFDDLHVNGELTLGENIGDLSGVTIAYRAYQQSLNDQPAPVIDGLTGDQRFFMGYAQIWRVKMREKTLRNRVATDSHSPGKFRALGSLSNMPAFYEAFALKETDAMYLAPEKRVKIW